MKISSLFNLVTDADDVLDLFDGVNNVDQLRGRLRRLSQIEADDLLTCLEGLRTSITAALEDTLEMHPDLDVPEIPDELENSGIEEPTLAELTETSTTTTTVTEDQDTLPTDKK